MWQQYASSLGIPIRVAMRLTTYSDLLLWVANEERKIEQEVTSHQRQDYLFARVCLELARLRATFAGKKRCKEKLKDFLMEFKMKAPPKPVRYLDTSKMTPKQLQKARAKAALASKLAWGGLLGMSPEVFK